MDVLKLKVVTGKCEQLEVPTQPLQRSCFAIVTHPRLEVGILLAILINVAVMSMPYYGAPAAYLAWTAAVNKGFSAFFFLEAVLKLVGLGVKEYVKDRFN